MTIGLKLALKVPEYLLKRRIKVPHKDTDSLLS
jgi:hypothetical protein